MVGLFLHISGGCAITPPLQGKTENINMSKINREAALQYHSCGKKGKIEIVPTKPHSTQEDLSLAYTPGVAEPCREIQKYPDDAYKYTG